MAGSPGDCSTCDPSNQSIQQLLRPDTGLKEDQVAKSADLVEVAKQIAEQGKPEGTLTRDAVKEVSKVPSALEVQKLSTGETSVTGDSDPGDVLDVKA